MKIFVAIPTYDGKLPIQVVHSLLFEKEIAIACGDELKVGMLAGCSHPAQGRNQLADDFLKSDCERMIFLDSDVSFGGGAIVKLAHQPVDLVGGGYRHKHTDETYPVHFDASKKECWADRRGLIEVAGLPGGFMCISRNVFEQLKASNPARTFEFWGREMFCFFEMSYANGVLGSEDLLFCKSWRDIGGKVYLDPELKLVHWCQKMTPYEGHIGNWLKTRPQEIECQNQ